MPNPPRQRPPHDVVVDQDNPLTDTYFIPIPEVASSAILHLLILVGLLLIMIAVPHMDTAVTVAFGNRVLGEYANLLISSHVKVPPCIHWWVDRH